ncbi:hypothetical protein [Calidithermus roseus]|uniref:hypothetical protein n=1 Tax=Calidithermus roseus TaxID=1644118 RepID=UPI0011C427E2|nr:hypothetical protein [Calidithermus roseus]
MKLVELTQQEMQNVSGGDGETCFYPLQVMIGNFGVAIGICKPDGEPAEYKFEFGYGPVIRESSIPGEPWHGVPGADAYNGYHPFNGHGNGENRMTYVSELT